MSYKMILVGMYYEGEEPALYPECTHPQEQCNCEQSIADAINAAVRKNQPNITDVDTAFLQHQDRPQWSYTTWSKNHLKEVYKHYLWKIFTFLNK
jgi:hypothetical protein